MKPGLLASLLRDTSLIAQRAARLRDLLPHTNVSAMASKLPEILLQVTSCCLFCVLSFCVLSFCMLSLCMGHCGMVVVTPMHKLGPQRILFTVVCR